MDCVKTVSIAKAVPGVFVIPTGPFVFNVPVRVNITTGRQPGGCASCANPATVTGGTLTVTLIGPGGPFVATLPMAAATSGFSTQIFQVPVTVLAGTVGRFIVQVDAAVNFSADSMGAAQTGTATGDNVVCFVEETAPGSGVPRLDMRLLGDPLPECRPGQPTTLLYEITNNDAALGVTLTLTAESGQNSYRPTATAGDPNRFYALAGGATGTGDHMPIVFGDLPPPPVANPLTFFQPPLTRNVTIPPLQSALVPITINSHGPPAHVPGCLDGTCTDQTLVAQGMFANGDPALACAGAGFSVNSQIDCGCDFRTLAASSLGVGDDTVTTVNLGFSFPFPDGTVVTQVDVDSNGRVFPVGADTFDFTETVVELLTQTTSICPWWDDQSVQVLGDVFVDTTATSATLAWIDTSEFPGGNNPFSVELQLHASGRVVFSYDGDLGQMEDGLVGLSEGGGAPDPGGSDLSNPLSTGTATTVYQCFPGGMTDLAGLSIEFTPNGIGGWVTNIIVLPCAPGIGFGTDTGSPTNRAFTYTPNLSGGYSIGRAVGTFVDDSATSIDLNSLATGSGDDENYTVTLGFPFAFPGGAVVTDIVVDTNGRIMADGSDPSDFSPSVAEALTGAPGSIVPWWCDMTPVNGVFTFSTTPTEAIVTMLDVPQFLESNTISWQCTMRSDNSFTINYLQTHTWRTGSGLAADDVIAGSFSGTSGSGADPGEGDHAQAASLSNSEGTFYERWDASFDEVPATQPVLDLVGMPVLGGVAELRMTGISSTALFTSLFFGFSNPGDVPLDLIGVEGGTLSSSADVVIALSVTGEDASFSLSLPLDLGLVGLLSFDVQGVYVAVGDTTLGAVLTNGVNVDF